MIAVTFREPTEADLAYLADHMREMDVRECRLTAHMGPAEALRESVDISLWSYAALVDETPVCAFGLASDGILSDEAAPWMLCAEGIERHAKAVLIFAKRFIAQMQENFERLVNVVHADNRSAIRFIKWCGFELGESMTIAGEPFIWFEMRRERVMAAAA